MGSFLKGKELKKGGRERSEGGKSA